MSESSIHSQYLTFAVAGEEYALPILRVKEIIEYTRLTRVPGIPPHIRGVINLRGTVMPVIDLAVQFGFTPSVVSRTSCIVIVELSLEGERTVAGVIADAVRQVAELGESSIEPPPAFGTQARVEFVRGMGVVDEKLVLLLDIDAILSPAELVTAVETATEPAQEALPLVAAELAEGAAEPQAEHGA